MRDMHLEVSTLLKAVSKANPTAAVENVVAAKASALIKSTASIIVATTMCCNLCAASEWYAYVDGRITLGRSGSAELTYLTDPELDDYKPVPSPDGSQVGFFHVVDYNEGTDLTWRTQIAVMNADGSDLRYLTAPEQLNTNPQWTRDGSNRLFWTRVEHYINLFGTIVPTSMQVYWTKPDAMPGEEQKISAGGLWPWVFVYSGLRDGRLFVRKDGLNSYWLMTPNPTGDAVFEEVSYPFGNTLLHKVTISPSENRIAYMKVSDAGLFTNVTPRTYTGAVIAYADFDAETLQISNEVEVTTLNEEGVDWYASWSPDESRILYACAGPCPAGKSKGQIYEYDLRTKQVVKVSANDELDFRYPAYKGTVK
ncbi:MAG: hypothetical protein AAGC91_09490 [Pseudomonadota bacterium]